MPINPWWARIFGLIVAATATAYIGGAVYLLLAGAKSIHDASALNMALKLPLLMLPLSGPGAMPFLALPLLGGASFFRRHLPFCLIGGAVGLVHVIYSVYLFPEDGSVILSLITGAFLPSAVANEPSAFLNLSIAEGIAVLREAISTRRSLRLAGSNRPINRSMIDEMPSLERNTMHGT